MRGDPRLDENVHRPKLDLRTAGLPWHLKGGLTRCSEQPLLYAAAPKWMARPDGPL